MVKIKLFLMVLVLVCLNMSLTTSIAQTIEPNKHPIQTACVAFFPDGSQVTVGYSNDCELGGEGCVDNTCPGVAPPSVGN